MFKEEELTRDAFLGGSVHLLQPRRGFRAGTDSVMLAASVPALAGQTVLELGCGAGAALICLCSRVRRLRAAALELLPEYASLARRNLETCGLAADVFEGCVSDPPKELRKASFDHVLLNPPYHEAGSGRPSSDRGRDTALREGVPLRKWVSCALNRLKPGGRMTIIIPPLRLVELMEMAGDRAGSMSVKPLCPRAGTEANRFLIRATKGGRIGIRILTPLVLHEGSDGEGGSGYTAEAEKVLRSGAAVSFARQANGSSESD